ncbi:MAG: glycine--tRNA ligase [Phycisphaerales bacterium JB058]
MEDQQQTNQTKSMDDIMALCKRRGFIYQASEIYGGINGFWDYGPLGAQLKKNLRDAWWQDVVMNPCVGQPGPDGEPVEIVPVDTCIIQNPKVWEASGHVGGFNDPMVDDKETKQRFRADHLMGIYADIVALSPEAQSAVRQLLNQSVGVSLPVATIIASNASEAYEIIAKDRSLQKVLGIKGVGPVASNSTEQEMHVLMGFKDNHSITATIHPVSMEVLKLHSEFVPSPFTGKAGSLTPPRDFNLMFKTYVGATSAQTEENTVYLRPETAQGIFINFKNVVDTTRVSVPFGIAQTGKAFRNEVTPRNFTFRSREFEQMEIEFFCHADDAKTWFTFWRDWRYQWWQEIGLAGDNLILRNHDSDELAHYAKEGEGTSDIEYRFPFTAPGYGELEGIAHRGNFDLSQHEEHSKKKMQYFDTTRGELAPNGQPKGEWYTPHCIEPSAGLDRGVLAIICEAYTPDESRASKVFMKFHPRIAPIKAAVFPLVNKDGMPEKAAELHRELVRKFGHLGAIETDAKQSIGKRYARMDEAGCPICFTIDGDTLSDGTVTVRDRDTAEQKRIPMTEASGYLANVLGM